MKLILSTTVVLILCMFSLSAHAQQPMPPVNTDTATTTTTIESLPKFDTTGIKAWFAASFAKTEVWRLGQATYFKSVRDEKKLLLGIGQPPRQIDDIVIGTAGTEQQKTTGAIALDNPLDYAILIGTTSLATMFGNMSVFYISAGLLSLMLLRFVISRFV